MWLKLHLIDSGDEVCVQSNNICAIYPEQREGFHDITFIQFVGKEDNYLYVKETPEQIMNMMFVNSLFK